MLDKKANILYSYHELTMSPFSKEEIKNIDDLRKVKNEKIFASTDNSV